MLRHPNVVRTTIAAERSWKLNKTVHLNEKSPHDQLSTTSGSESGSEL